MGHTGAFAFWAKQRKVLRYTARILSVQSGSLNVRRLLYREKVNLSTECTLALRVDEVFMAAFAFCPAPHVAGIRAIRQKGLGTLWSKRRRAGVWRQSTGLSHDAGAGFLSTPLRGAPKNPGTLPRAKKHAISMFFASAARPPPFRVPTDVPKKRPSGGTPEGTRDIMEQTPSSRRLAAVHRTAAFNCSSPFA